MCSVNDSDCNDVLELLSNDNIDIGNGMTCQKCNENEASIKLRGKDVYCQTCFLVNITHKFRATLGKSKIVRNSDNVLVGHSGGGGSTALLHLIKAGMHESMHKRVVFQTKVFYIDDGMLRQQSPTDRQTTINEIAQQIKPFGFEAFVASLSTCYNGVGLPSVSNIENYSCTCDEVADKKLIEMFDKILDHTSRQDLLKKLREKIITSAALALNCQKVFLADDATSLAISILNNVSLGRGAQLSLNVGFIDDRYTGVMILRPIKDFSGHELNCYLNINRLSLVNVKKLVATANPQASIQELTEKFVTELDSQFNGTVSTIFRTSEKLSSGKNISSVDEMTCALCNASIDTMSLDDGTSAVDATLFAKFMSSKEAKDKIQVSNSMDGSSKMMETCETNCSNECQGDCTKLERTRVSMKDIRKCLCYGCKLIFHDEYSPENLPAFVTSSVRDRLCLQNMREQIQDFLL